MAPFKDEHLSVAASSPQKLSSQKKPALTLQSLIIVPGSRTTLAQVGLPESFTPARVRIKSRMFPTDTPGKYEPYRIRPKPRQVPQTNGQAATSGQSATNEAQPKSEDAIGEAVGDTDVQVTQPVGEPVEEDVTLEEDPMSDAGAIWPIQGGRIVDWPCFFALMQHLHNMLGGSFHTPVMLIAQPAWTPVEHIRITHFFFEKFKCPAFALMDAAQAMCYAYGVPSACVVDIGRDKADVTAINEFMISTINRGIALPDLGGEAITQNLLSHMKGEGWDRKMCEQLKLSPICEVLPPGTPIPGSKEAAQAEKAAANGKDKPSNPAAAASTGADGSGAQQRNSAAAQGEGPRGPGQDNEGRPGEVGEEDAEGVIDVATIVAGGKTSEYVAQKEKEKRDKAAAAAKRKGAEASQAQAKARLRNSEREFNSFVYDDKTARERAKDVAADGHPAPPSAPVESAPAAAPQPPPTTTADPPPLDTSVAGTTQPDPTSPTQTSPQTASGSAAPKLPSNPYTRSLTAGPARFRSLPESYMPNLTLAIWRAIQAVPGLHARQAIWDHILITGQGARVRGLKEAVLAELAARFLITPSSASIFTSEPPSSFGTPGGTGANSPLPMALPHGQSALPPFTPQGAPPPPQMQMQMQGGVNPLLYTATQNAGGAPPPQFRPGAPPITPQRATPQPPLQSNAQASQTPYRGATPVHATQSSLSAPAVGAGMAGKTSANSQTPTSVRTARLPEYFGEWKEAGADFEAAFLGAQVAAKVVFLADVQGGSNKGFMSRSDYNEQGPSAIADYSL